MSLSVKNTLGGGKPEGSYVWKKYFYFDPTTVSWSNSTDEEIVKMVNAADKGLINLADYWSVGDERQVTLSRIGATEDEPPFAKQTVTFVLMNAGGKTLANPTASGRSECSFIVGMKNGLAEKRRMDSTSKIWDSCFRRTWCNSRFRNAIPESLRGIFKQHLNVTADGPSTTTVTSTDYFALPAEKEVFGSNTYADSTAEASLSQFEYYATEANRIKKVGDGGSADNWWERSTHLSYGFCRVLPDGRPNYDQSPTFFLLSPFGVI